MDRSPPGPLIRSSDFGIYSGILNVGKSYKELFCLLVYMFPFDQCYTLFSKESGRTRPVGLDRLQQDNHC